MKIFEKKVEFPTDQIIDLLLKVWSDNIMEQLEETDGTHVTDKEQV